MKLGRQTCFKNIKDGETTFILGHINNIHACEYPDIWSYGGVNGPNSYRMGLNKYRNSTYFATIETQNRAITILLEVNPGQPYAKIN